MLALLVEVVLVILVELGLLDVSTEVVVKVGKAVSVLVREGALALVNDRFASLLDEVAAAAAAAAAASLVVDMMRGGWEGGRPDGYLSRRDAGVMHEGRAWRQAGLEMNGGTKLADPCTGESKAKARCPGPG
jgi:hypothetical protein